MNLWPQLNFHNNTQKPRVATAVFRKTLMRTLARACEKFALSRATLATKINVSFAPTGWKIPAFDSP